MTTLLLALALSADAGKTPATVRKLSLDEIAKSVTELRVEPQSVVLDDPRLRQQLIVTGVVGAKLVDLTNHVTIQSANEKVAKISDRREVIPSGDGVTELAIQFAGKSAKVAITTKNFTHGRAISFPNEIVPIFTKLGCNGGGCHGKSGGQNGFRLSLLGFEPKEDFEYLLKEGRGRRVFPASPSQSVLLRKASGGLPHGGGKLMKVDDDNYRLFLAWMAQGMPYGQPTDPVVTKIEVSPSHRVMDRNSSQRIRVTATYSDGRTEDVTRQAVYKVNAEDVASVDTQGLVTTLDMSGETAVMARYMGQVAVFRASVPVGLPTSNPTPFQIVNFIDQHASKKWADLGLQPSVRVSDSGFVRRVYLDTAGRLPTLDETNRFLASTDPAKRQKLIEEVLHSSDYASHMAMKWGAILQNRRAGNSDFASGTHRMSAWLKSAFLRDMPYNQFVGAILTATGTPDTNPPVSWFRNVRTKEDNVDNVSQLFLGTRVQCARCHHHPFEKWGQDDYYSMAGFFSRLGRKQFEKFPSGQPNEAVFTLTSGESNHPKTGARLPPKGLDGKPYEVEPGDDPREKLVEWLTEPSNPFFARALVNRLWGHFFNRGIVEPIDDMRVTNPPTNPELLDALAKDFVDHGFSIRHTVRMILNSSTYQLSAEPNAFNKYDKQSFARYYPRRLPAEVLLDALDEVTGVKTELGFPKDLRTVELPDEQIGSYFLDIFGRPQRGSSCECERNGDANLSQSLHLLNSGDIQAKLTHGQGRASLLATDKRTDKEKVTELFVRFFARLPRDEELSAALEHITAKKDKSVAYQNVIWALLNTKEFLFNT